MYSMAVVNLASTLGEAKSQYESALQLALPAITKIEVSPLVDRVDVGCILVTIGFCQTGLERFDEARKSFDKAYRIFREYEKNKDCNLRDYRECLKAMCNATASYSGFGMPDEELRYAAFSDSLLTWYRHQPGYDKDYADWINGKIYLARAEALADKHQMEEANSAYEQFLHTPFGESEDGQFASCTYLGYAGRYAEAADILKEYDRYAYEWEKTDPDLEEINDNIFPKFRYNYRAGRKDSALAVAVRIDSLIGPAIRAQKRSDAAELATIYETQQKEAKIAEREATINHQRIIGLLVALVLIIVLFTVYTLIRRRMMRMKAQHEQLENELRIARDIQMSMVPSTFPDLEGLDMYAQMTPAKEVGGDLYGYVVNDSRLYFAVGDVSGKGVPASLFMA